MRLKLFFVLSILLLAAAIVAGQMRQNRPTENSHLQTIAAEEAAVEQATPAGAETGIPSDQEFKGWLQSEAAQMDTPRAASENKEQEMNSVAAKISRKQARDLLETARDPQAKASEKILSTYLLVRAGARATQELKELIVSPVAEAGPAHSEDEMTHMREKTLRIMALDGLSSQAASDPGARAVLAKTINEIQDPYVKEYARQQLGAIAQ